MEEDVLDNNVLPSLTSVEPTLAGIEPMHVAKETSLTNVGPTLAAVEPMHVANEPSLAGVEPMHVAPTLTSVEPMHVAKGAIIGKASNQCMLPMGHHRQGLNQRWQALNQCMLQTVMMLFSDAMESAASTPNKKVQFLGLDTVFGEKSNPLDNPLDISISPGHVPHLEPGTELTESGQNFAESSPKATVTWATLDSPSRAARGTGHENSPAKSLSSPAEGLYRFETALYGSKEGDDRSEGDSDDPFMMYLNSIEQTALKFKLQVKLERAYEGTPLEEIPLKFQEKLQETIAQIASDEVLKKYEALVSQDEEMSEEENQILECMRNELDSKNFDNLDDGMSSIRNEYERKNGESEFLSERVESLEKSIVNLRVEYNNEITDLQNENLQLQKACFELENRNKILEEEIAAGDDEEESCDSRAGDMEREDQRHRFIANREFELLQLRLEESERQNKALRAASQADQAVIHCMEDKKDELEKALVKAQDESQ
ncbi:hypothetical protein OS493_029472 [Desmophyllum pertusum]|uniref:Uncharacterized protein n=1 Tax=Desmophyllum pertusum TaxID=174260 RepID=A0A9W9YC76_9CNID|nr:hypothetical protein OS493_029472 [Desmophyllum pertusum]